MTATPAQARPPSPPPERASAPGKKGSFLFSWTVYFIFLFLSLLAVNLWLAGNHFVLTQNSFQRWLSNSHLSDANQMLKNQPNLLKDCSPERFVNIAHARLCKSNSGLYAEIVDGAGKRLWQSPSSKDPEGMSTFPFPKQVPPKVAPRPVETETWDVKEDWIAGKLFQFRGPAVQDKATCYGMGFDVSCYFRVFSDLELYTLHEVFIGFADYATNRFSDSRSSITSFSIFAPEALGAMLKYFLVMVALFLLWGLALALVILVPLGRLYRDLNQVLNYRKDTIDLAGYPSELQALANAILNLVQQERKRIRSDELVGILSDIGYATGVLHNVQKPLITMNYNLERLPTNTRTGDGISANIRQADFSHCITIQNAVIEAMNDCLRVNSKLLKSAELLLRDKYASEKAAAPVIDLVMVARQVIDTIQPAQRGDNEEIAINFEMEVSGTGTGKMRMDENHLDQMLDSLIGNANNKYAESEILVKAKVEELQVIISVEDDGEGISLEFAEDLEHLLEIGVTDSDRDDGYGVGLFCVKSIAGTYNGDVKIVRNGPCLGGALFTVRIPTSG